MHPIAPFLIPLLAAQQAAVRDPGKTPEPVTFTEHVAPLLYAHCTPCHRPGEIGPFSLITYRDVRKRMRTIERVVVDRYMPPWHPVPGWGEFRDPRRLTDREIATIRAWVRSGGPEGPREKLPPLPDFPSGWQLGQPDLVVEMPEAFRVPASGPDIYRNFVIPLGLPEDRYVTAVEIRPTARNVLHHCLFFLDDSGRARSRDGADGQPGFFGMGFPRSGSLGGWAVGATPRHLPLGLAFPLPKGSDLILASHFHPSGKVEYEKTRLGLFFAKRPPSRTLLGFMVPPRYGALWGIDIPAGERRYLVTDRFEVPCDIELVGVGGHAHYLARSMKAVATLPDGTHERLFFIANWDFNWQGRYHYRRPVVLPKGSVVEVEIAYDNSRDNPRNPFDPPRRVRWGLQSTDEMGAIIFTCVARNERDVPAFRAAVRRQRRTAMMRRALRWTAQIRQELQRADADRDGKLTRREFPARFRRWFPRLDRNGDGVIDAGELERLERGLRRR